MPTAQEPAQEQSYGGIAGADLVAGTAVGKTVDWALAHLGQKTLQRNLLNYNFANFAVRDGQYQGNILGLNQQQIDKMLPFPQSPASVTVQNIESPPAPAAPDETPVAEDRPWWKRALPLAAAVATGAGVSLAGLAAYNYANRPPAPVVNETTMPGEIGLQVE